MTDPRARILVCFGLIAVVLGVGAWVSWGARSGLGFGLGVVGTSGGLLGWWFAIRAMGRALADERVGCAGSTLAVLAFLLKLPVILACWRAAEWLGPPAPVSFLWGLALVYCALVSWALVQR